MAPQCELIDLPLLISEALLPLRTPLSQKGLNVSVSGTDGDLPPLHSDPLRIRQILDRLLDNAVKFTPSGEIRIEVSGDEHEIRIAIRDSGPGIARENHEAVFEKFKQLEHFLTRHHGGIGLGLALSRQLASLLGGYLSLESEIGEGACFTLHLPLQQGDLHA